MTQHQCTKPCGSIDCAYGCITGQPWTGSEVDSRAATSGVVKVVSAPPDPIQQAVDHWIDMERKAKAWDAALKEADEAGAVGINRYDLDLIWQSA